MVVKKNKDGTVDCVSPWSIYELEDALGIDIWLDAEGHLHISNKKVGDDE